MSAPFSEFMCAALGTPDTSQPTEGAQPDFHKPYAYEFARVDTEGRFKIVIEHHYPRDAKSDWPVIPLYRRPSSNSIL
ncbi:hypothetical protein D3C71_547060 [compost metagenome]